MDLTTNNMGAILEKEIKKVLAVNAEQFADRPSVIKDGFQAQQGREGKGMPHIRTGNRTESDGHLPKPSQARPETQHWKSIRSLTRKCIWKYRGEKKHINWLKTKESRLEKTS
jgi:hypothetical protein